MSPRLLLPLLGLITLVFVWVVWSGPENLTDTPTPAIHQTPVASSIESTAQEDLDSTASTALPRTHHPEAEETEKPEHPPLPESITIRSTSGLPVRRIIVWRSDGKVEHMTLETPGILPLQGFDRYDMVFAVGHHGRQLIYVDDTLELSPSLELRITNLPEDVLRDPSSIEIDSLERYKGGAQEWQLDTGIVDGVWVLALASTGRSGVRSATTNLGFPMLPGQPVVQLIHGSFDNAVISVPWHEIARVFPQTTVQEFRLDASIGTHTAADWEVLILDTDGHPPTTETIREGPWGILHGKLARTVTAKEHGPSLALEGVPVGMQVAALAISPSGHYTWFPAEVAGRSGRIETPKSRPSYRGMVHVQESVEPGDVPLLHETSWSASIEPKRFRKGWDPLPQEGDGTFHLNIPLAASDLHEWDRLGGRPKNLTLHVGAGTTETDFQVKEMVWDGIVDFDPIQLARKTPALVLQTADLNSEADMLYFQPDFDSTRPGIRLVERAHSAWISELVAGDGGWKVYLEDGATVPPGPTYLQLGYQTRRYFRKEGRAHYTEMEDVAYHLVFSEAFLRRHDWHALSILVGGLEHTGRLPLNWNGRDPLDFRMQAPTDGVVLTAPTEGRSEQVHVYPLKPGRQVLE